MARDRKIVAKVIKAVTDMKECPTKPSATNPPVKPIPYDPDVGDFAYKGGKDAENRFFACRGRALCYWWVSSTGQLI